MRHTPVYICLILSCILYTSAQAQVWPRNRDSLHYRLIGFSVPQHEKATTYTLQVFPYAEDSRTILASTPLLQQDDTGNHIIATVPEFGKSYCWRVLYKKRKHKYIDSTGIFFFTVRSNPYSDTNITKLRILTPASDAHKDLMVFNDNSRTLYNMQGEALWFLPDIPGISNNNYKIRDLKLTPQNTITFLSADIYACEIDYNGHMLWQAPDDGKVSGENMEHYHHELTRLGNGHYMMAGNKTMPRKLPEYVSRHTSSERKIYAGEDGYYIDTEAGTLIEYDSAGNVVWSWVSGEHFNDSDLFTPLPDGSLFTDTHLNGFFFNEADSVIYASFRDVSRIVKISYPSGKVINSYGSGYSHNPGVHGDSLFYGQHACRINNEGNLYLFNNNYSRRTWVGKKPRSHIVILKEPQGDSTEPQLLWSFNCDIDSFASGHSTRGGNVYELRNGDILVCMGAPNRYFIVNRNKQVVWNALLELRRTPHRLITPAYRMSPLYTDQLPGLLYR
ncbi:MAG: aryl-sulfate sulfotransferase [Chitinophagaceae bacterium]|nr:aryl-sulfate sulfotransferase [Chitinophagaceae bacterium]MCB9044524.1 aryl-sulfate sulfotransferase [Chitinophagales bacterium]